MVGTGTRAVLLAGVALTAFFGCSSVATAQAVPATSDSRPEQLRSTVDGGDEIVVTARKREETSISAPVNVTGVSGNELQRRAIVNVDAVARLVPGLIVGEGGGTVQGGIVAIRGLSGADSNPLNDQAVSFNIDGVQVARASIRRLSQMDLAQIEVLKGPQALFFGKNSPGGVISVTTADPTSTFQARVTTGYEFNADETRTEGYISAPLTSTLGVRLAGYFSNEKGDVHYVQTPARAGATIFPARYNRAPHQTEYAGRLTLKWEPTDRLRARAKLSYNSIRGAGSSVTNQMLACPLGRPQSASADDCKVNDTTSTGGLGPNFGAVDSRFGDGTTFLHQRQLLGGLELNYDLTDNIRLTSVTGYYRLKLRNRANFTYTDVETGAPPAQILGSVNFLDLREVTEELRVATSFDGPVNFTLGGLYQDSHGRNGAVTYRNALKPAFINNYLVLQDGVAYSTFIQATINLAPTVELSGGGRYSHERKTLPSVFSSPLPGLPTTLVPNATGSRATFNNLSPEATLSWRPTGDLTVYGSYKEGFLSGGFNAGAANLAGNLAYDQQLIHGFEGGVKARLLDGALRTNLAVYNYKTDGLQVSVAVNGTTQELRNAGSVRTKGVEFDFNYRTPFPGLSLNGAVAYERGRYLDYQASCSRGLPSTVCFVQLNRQTRTMALLHDLSGTQLVRAPTWTGNVGFTYEAPISNSLKLSLSGNASHSDSYFTDPSSPPGSRQPSFELYDAAIGIGSRDDRWDVSVVGRNLGNTYYFVRSTDSPFTGAAPGVSAAGGLAGDTAGPVSRGREVMLRLSVKFGG